MESASIAFCYEALRHCYHILGRERFRAETEYVMKCFENTSHIDNSCKPIELKQLVEDLPVENKVIEIKKETAKPILKKVKEAQHVEAPKNEVIQVDAPKNEVIQVEKTKWKRTQLPDEDRCKRILPYNGGQCTFKKMDGCDYCTRHVDK